VQIRDFIDESHEALAQAQAESLQVSISMDAGDLDWPDIRALVLAYERVEPIARMLGGDIDNPACQPLDLAYTTALGLRYKSSEPGGAYRSQITGVAAAGAGAAGRLTPDQAERAGRSRCRVGDFTPMTRSGIEITSWLTGHRGAGRPISQRKHAKAAPGTCVVFNAVHRWRNGDRVYNCAMFYQDLMLSARLLGVARGGIMLPRSAIKAAEAISPGLKASIIASVQTWRKNFPPGEREYVVAKGKWVTR
jgi:hypothetical protein